MIIDHGPFKDGLPAIHPGESLADDLEEMDMTAEELDRALAVPWGTVEAVLEGRRPITADLALRLSHYLGTTARIWMDLQSVYDLKVALKKSGHDIEEQVQPRPDMPFPSEDWED